MALLDFFKKIEPDKKTSPFLHTLYDGFFTFAYAPNSVTKGTGVQIRDGMDLKRTMIMVVMALASSMHGGISFGTVWAAGVAIAMTLKGNFHVSCSLVTGGDENGA